MSRTAFRGPKLPKDLLEQVGAPPSNKKRGDQSRKDRRKAERQQKKQHQHGNRSRPLPTSRGTLKPSRVSGQNLPSRDDSLDEDEFAVFDSEPEPVKPGTPTASKPLKSILKRELHEESEDEGEAETEFETEFESGSTSDNDVAIPTEDFESSPRISQRAAKSKLADDDAEIAALEKKLGRKGKKGTKSDDFDFLLGDLGDDSEDDNASLKRKRPEDTKWLRDKRFKASGATRKNGLSSGEESASGSEIEGEDGVQSTDGGDGEDGSIDDDEIENPFSEDEISNDDFDESEGSVEDAPAKAPRENPYVAPVPKNISSAAKYVPPSLRKASASEEEALKRLRKQIQGQLNRLSEANTLSILQAVEDLYEKNPRQHVKSTLIDLLVSLVADPSILNETFLILHAAFSAAVYKVIGIDFGAQLVEKLVEQLDTYRTSRSSEGKQALNLMAFLANLYTFQVVGSAIIFDYIRILLATLSEDNTELLLRVVRTSGAQLRKDDPSSLKDIVLLLQRQTAETGEASLSVRTKFMIETIHNLKNNRVNTGASTTANSAEHTTRMRKTIGTLNTRSKTTEPLRIGLADIRDREKKGKWWLVGASYNDPAKLANGADTTSKTGQASKVVDPDAGYESETPGHVSVQKLARSIGMKTSVREAIFISIMSAVNYQDAQVRLQKLHLSSKRKLEIPAVLIICCETENLYNPYYAILARHLCNDDNKLRRAFRFSLWNTIGRLDENKDHDDDDDDDDELSARSGSMNLKKITKLARFYGSILAAGELAITSIKGLEFASLTDNGKIFAELLLTTMMVQARLKDKTNFESRVSAIFSRAAEAPRMMQGMRMYIESTVSKAMLALDKREKSAVRKGCEAAIQGLQRATEGASALIEEDESD